VDDREFDRALVGFPRNSGPGYRVKRQCCRKNTFLGSRQAELQIELRQLVASVSLINNLGGGWVGSELSKVANGDKPLSDKDVAQKHNDAADSGQPAPIAPANPPDVSHDIQPDEILKRDIESMTADPKH
jgi:hypothetical protein